MHWQDDLQSLLDRVEVKAWRLSLTTPQVRATVPMVRGVWGRALRHVDAEAYRRVFASDGPAHRRLPRYILRPAPPDPATAPAVEWILLGIDERLESVLWRAWDIASGMGLGPTRSPFAIRRRLPLGPGSDRASSEAKRWKLSDAGWPLSGDPASTPCGLDFPAPLRLIRQGRLLATPTPVDIATAALRRVASLTGEAKGETYRDMMRAVQQEAAGLATHPWHGERSDLVRWSAAQRREIDLHGVIGGLELPAGPGRLWPLFAASSWAHVGKGTVFGLGELRITALDDPGCASAKRMGLVESASHKGKAAHSPLQN